MSASRVEIPQQRAVKLLSALSLLLRLRPFGIDVIRDHALYAKLRVTVWVCRPQRALLGNGYHVREACRVAVYGCGGREDDVGDMVFLHATEEGESAADVDAVVF